jgi:SAM-dependent methyltransferase
VGVVHGRYSQRDYHLARCRTCGYAFIVDPWLDFAEIYDERYYAGQGADPLVDYRFELDHPESTIRLYEWRGLAAIVEELARSDLQPSRGASPISSRRWLDYGCGNGGLVRYLRGHHSVNAFGFEEGSIAAEIRRQGFPLLSAEELVAETGSFDVVTAIEVLEHTLDPVAELRKIRSLLLPGGLLVLTTGNARPYADRLTRWKYVLPEIHISFFEPRTLERALGAAGFRPERRPLGPGFDEVLKFKVLKNLHFRRRTAFTDALPSSLVGPIANRMTKLREHPVGWAL